jgi:hypothetical protein
VKFVGQRQDECTYAVDPCHQDLIRAELPRDVEVATVAIVQIKIPGPQLLYGAARRGAVDQLIETSAGEALT